VLLGCAIILVGCDYRASEFFGVVGLLQYLL
jgi:hypothetical protein